MPSRKPAQKPKPKASAAKVRPRRSVIEVLPKSEDDFYEVALTSVLSLLKSEETGSVFLQRDRGTMFRVTVERITEAKA